MTTRIFTDQKLALNTSVELSAAASTHLLKVLRHTVDDSVLLFNGDGHDYLSIICKAAKRATLTIEKQLLGQPKSPLKITLVQGISRGDRMDFSVQKAVELGVHIIQPVFTEKTKVRLDADRLLKKTKHWEAIAVSACEQCGRSELPEIRPAVNLTKLLEKAVQQPSLVLTIGDHPHLAQAVSPPSSQVVILIGPESGLSDIEVTQALAAGWQPCQIGPRVLRTETATIAALAILQHHGGDLKTPPSNLSP